MVSPVLITNSHFFFADAPLIHTLDRMNSKD